LEKAGLEMKKSNSSMSFSVSSNTGNKGCEWSSNNLAGLFAQKQNLVNPFFYQMIRELVRFKDDVFRYLEKLQKKDDSSVQENETLGGFLNSHNYSQKFRECYVIPTCASIWPYPSEIILGFSAASILTFYWNNHLLQVFGNSQCLRVKDHSKTFIAKMVADLEAAAGSHILTKSGVTHISTTSEGVCMCHSL
jgi:cyclopropane-fatty-acyl-phospholipid synthase